MFEDKQPAGPFTNVKSFHDWFALTTNPGRETEISPIFAQPWRDGLLDKSTIIFTHADLHRSNIMISRNEDGKPYIIGLIDWHQSGWYPAPWEYYKTRRTCKNNEQWETDWILEFLRSHSGYVCWEFFASSLV